MNKKIRNWVVASAIGAGTLLGAGATMAATAAPAATQGISLMAASSTGPSSNGQTNQLTGNHAASYVDPVFGPVKCNETQHPAFDTVSCKFTAGQTQTPGATGTVGWISDFNNSLPQGTLTYTINADGMGYTGQATYPAA